MLATQHCFTALSTPARGIPVAGLVRIAELMGYAIGLQAMTTW